MRVELAGNSLNGRQKHKSQRQRWARTGCL